MKIKAELSIEEAQELIRDMRGYDEVKIQQPAPNEGIIRVSDMKLLVSAVKNMRVAHPDNYKIPAIKKVREMYQEMYRATMGLAEAKYFVEEIYHDTF